MYTAFTCRSDGTVITVLRNDFDILPALSAGTRWLDCLEEAAVPAARRFLEEISIYQNAVCSISLNHASGSSIFDLLGLSANQVIHIIIGCGQPAAGEAAESMKSGPNSPSLSADGNADLEGLSRLNSELVNLQRRLQQANHDLFRQQRMLERVFNASPDLLFVTEIPSGRVVLQNRESLGKLEHLSGESLFSPSGEDIHPEDQEKLAVFLEHLKDLENGEVADLEFRLAAPGNKWRWYLRRDTSYSFNPDQSVREILTLYQDITDRQEARQKLVQLSTRDALTNLYNRVYFDQELERLQDSRQYPVSILVADVDGLKPINDAFGHSAGDRLIKRAAEVLRKSFRNEDVVARMGGDEFGIILARTSAEDLPNIMGRIRKYLQEYNEDLSQTEIQLSIGFATAERGDQLEQVLREADIRMYSNKKDKKNHGS